MFIPEAVLFIRKTAFFLQQFPVWRNDALKFATKTRKHLPKASSMGKSALPDGYRDRGILWLGVLVASKAGIAVLFAQVQVDPEF